MSTIQKAYIQRVRADGTLEGTPFKVNFNPTEYTLNKGVQLAEIAIPGLDSPIVQFVRGQTETLTLELFFDTTDSGMGRNAAAVTTLTDQFYELVKIDHTTHAPPICRFTWGPNTFAGSQFSGQWSSQRRENGFQCIIESIRQRFTLFSPAGIPLRATLSVTMKEYSDLATQLTRLNLQSPDHTNAHVVTQGDTLARIAAETYGDPAQWRTVANNNSLDDPLAITPGMIIEVPPIN